MEIPDWQVEGTMEKAQRDALLMALVAHGYRVAGAAVQLRISRSTTYRLIERYGIIIPDPRPST